MPEGSLVAKVGTVVKKDPDLRFSKDGKPVTKFSMQVKPWVPKSETQPEPVYYDVTCFGTLAENVAESVRKGHRVVVIGTGKVEEWTGRDNQVHTSKVIIADGCGPDLRFVVADIHKSDDHPAARSDSEDDGRPF